MGTSCALRVVVSAMRMLARVLVLTSLIGCGDGDTGVAECSEDEQCPNGMCEHGACVASAPVSYSVRASTRADGAYPSSATAWWPST